MVALGPPAWAGVCGSGRRKHGRVAGEFGVAGGTTRWEHVCVGASVLGNMNWPWTAVAGRKTAQIGNCSWQRSPHPAQRRYNDLSMLSRLQTFTDGVVLQKQGSNTKPVWLVRAGLAAGAITNLPCESGSPVSIPSVQGRAGSHIQHGHLITATCARDALSWVTGSPPSFLLFPGGLH